MAEIKKYLDTTALTTLVSKIKEEDAKVLSGAKSYADGLASNYDAAGAAAGVQSNLTIEENRAKGEEARIEGLVNTAQGEIDALELVVAGKAAQTDLDALETLVGVLPEGTTAKDVVDYVNIKTAGIATDAALEELQGQLSGVQGEVATIKGDYLKAADKTELQGNIDTLSQTHDTDKAAIEARVKTIEDDYLVEADKTELQGNINAVSDVANAAVKQSDYDTKVKALEDEDTRIVGLVEAEAERAAGVESDLKERLVEVEAFFKLAEGESLDTALDTLVEIQEYITNEGSAADQMVLDIAANTKAIEDHIATNHDFATADAALKSELEGKINAKADATVVEGIDGRVEVVEGKVSTVEGKVSTLEGKVSTLEGSVATKVEQSVYDAKVLELEGADADLDERLQVVEAQLGDGENSVSDLIATAKQEAIDAAALDAKTKANTAETNAKGYADGLNTAMDTRVAAVEAKAHEHANKAELDLIASGDKAKWDEAYAKAHEHANKTVLDGITADKVAVWDTVSTKASQEDLDDAIELINANTSAINSFVAITSDEVTALFA